MRSLFKKLVGRRARKIYLWSGICLVTLTVLFYQIANWRGAKAWKAAQERLGEEGELFSISDLSPAPIPAAENFFATPALLNIAMVDGDGAGSGPHAELRERLETLHPRRKIEGLEIKPPKGNPIGPAPTDFAAWLEYARESGSLDVEGAGGDGPAARFLAALDRAHGPLFDELTDAASRPRSMITPTFGELAKGKRLYEVPVPHYRAVQSIAAALSLRAAAAAQTGDAEKAEESIRIVSRLADGCRNESLLIGMLVSMSLDEIRHRMVWETIRFGAFDPDSLERIRQQSTTVDNQAGLLSAMRWELMAARDATEWVREDGVVAAMVGINGRSSPALAFAINLAPDGWLDQNCAYLSNWYLDYYIVPLRDGDLRGAMTKSQEVEKLLIEAKAGWPHPHKILPAVAMPVFGSIFRKVIFAESRNQMEELAIGLEQYRLEAGSYPETLESLTPNYIATLPIDPCSTTGETMHYQKDGERYRIWSISLDGKDDGGVPDADADKRVTDEDYDGDWVWRFAEG